MKLYIYMSTLFLMLKLSICEKEWIKHEFKLVVEAGQRDCLYQTVQEQSVFHVSFQVIRGYDISLFISSPSREILKTFSQEATGSFQIQKTFIKGDYEICFDNSYSHLNDKLISIYILSFHQDKLMEKFRQEKELNETAHIARNATDKISINLVEIFTHQAMSRFRQTKDEYLIEANNSLVLYWSLFQTILIVLCGLFQVYFIRKLFNSSTPSKFNNKL